MPTASPVESLIAVLAMAVIALICRWAFTPTHTHRSDDHPADYGLLVSVTTAPTQADARMLRDLLVAQGIRASVSADRDVLVFARDVERARAVVS